MKPTRNAACFRSPPSFKGYLSHWRCLNFWLSCFNEMKPLGAEARWPDVSYLHASWASQLRVLVVSGSLCAPAACSGGCQPRYESRLPGSQCWHHPSELQSLQQAEMSPLIPLCLPAHEALAHLGSSWGTVDVATPASSLAVGKRDTYRKPGDRPLSIGANSFLSAALSAF